MTQILMVKGLGVLRPADDAAGEAIRRIKFGSTVAVEVKRPRNIRFHRLYWQLISIVFENQREPARYASTEDLHGAIKIAAGLRTQIELPGGVIGYMSGSIAFHKMTQQEFEAFFDKVCDLVAVHFLPGVTSEDLKREVEAMIGAVA